MDKKLQAKINQSWLNRVTTIKSVQLRECLLTAEVVRDQPYVEPVRRFDQTTIITNKIGVVAAIDKYRGEKVGVMNFASYRNPGGGFLKGSMAQEEALCGESLLYPVLDNNRERFYNKHRNTSAIYGSDMLFSKVYFYPGTDLNNEIPAYVLTAAAPNETAYRNRAVTEKALERRARMVIYKFAEEECDVLFLGAWGCGVFGNNTKFVANVWKEILKEYAGVFKLVVHPIPDEKNFKVFDGVLWKS